MTHIKPAPRIVTNFSISVLTAVGSAFKKASPVNLSETGVCLRIAIPLEIGQTVTLKMQVDDASPAIELLARVVWTRVESDTRQTVSGLGFIDLPTDYRDLIRAYVDLAGQSLLTFLSEFPLFRDFSLEDCTSLLRIVTQRYLKKREILYYQDEDVPDLQGLFIVKEGLLSIYRGHEHRADRQLAVVSTGQVFGESTLVSDQPFFTSIMAVNESTLLQINKKGFLRMRPESPELALKIMDVIAHTLNLRLGRTTRQLFSPIQPVA
jgi:hypothetical protein